MTMQRILGSLRRPWLVVGLLALSYLLVFTQRIGPGLVSNELQSEFHVTAAVLGTLSSVQYLLYMLLQIPVGLSGDKFGPERLFVGGVAFDALGTLVFANAHSFTVLLLARAFVGLGDALIWVNIVLILGKRFSAGVFGSLLAMVATAGNVGALLATIPFAAWLAVAGWRAPFTDLGIVLFVVAAFDLIALKAPTHIVDLDAPRLKITKIPMRTTMQQVLVDRNAWATFCCHFGAVGNYLSFVGLWAIPYFIHAYHLTADVAARFTLVAFFGALLGGPIVGAISDRLRTRRSPYIVIQALSTIAWLIVPVANGQPPMWVAYSVMFIVGFGSGGSLLTFALIRDQTEAMRVGVTSGFANTGGFLSAVLMPVLFGAVLDVFNTSQEGATSHAYGMAFIVPAMFSFVGFCGSLMLVERHQVLVRSKRKTHDETLGSPTITQHPEGDAT